MGIVSFLKDAGEKLFGARDAEAATARAQAAPDDPAVQAALASANASAAAAITSYISAQGLKADGLTVVFDAYTSAVTVGGNAPDQATKEKILLCCGNVQGVEQVVDQMTADAPADESTWHTVVRGDTLSAIAKATLGNANLYPKIFEANRPMLSDPNKIYPGQVLRIPKA